jgi:flagellar export protein FliJ
MKDGDEYPLEQILDIKKKRVEEAERELEKRKNELEKEEDKLKKAEEARDKVKKHKTDKMHQIRQALDEGTTSDEVIGMKNYLKVVEEKLEGENKKVEAQKKVVEEKEKVVEEAKVFLKEKEREVDKIKMHREHWSTERKKEIERKEAAEQDELGSMMYLANKKKLK